MSKPILIKVDRNGTKHWADYTCRRCGGQGGLEQWAYTGFTCYDCGGSGEAIKPYIWKEYTPEYQAKLDAQREKREAKKLAERKAKSAELNLKFYERNGFDENGFMYLALGNTYETKDNLKANGFHYKNHIGWHSDKEVDGIPTCKVSAEDVYYKDNADAYIDNSLKKTFMIDGEEVEDNEDLTGYEDGFSWEFTVTLIREKENKKYLDSLTPIEAKKVSNYVGEVGERLDITLTLKREVSWESHFGYRTQTQYLYIFNDDNGNVLTWKTSNLICGYCEKTNDLAFAEVGDKVTMKATVKEQTIYEGVKQTVLTRCKIESVIK